MSGGHEVSTETRTIHNVCATFIAIVGFNANLIVMSAMVKSKLHQKVANVFVLNLIINNMIVCGLCLTYISVLSFTVHATDGTDVDNVLCRIVGYITYSIVATELLGLTLISLNRFFLVVQFNMYQRIYNNNRYVVFMISLSWIVFPVLFIFPVTKVWGSFLYDPQRFFCHPFYDDESFGKFLVAICLLVTVPVIGFCYIAILYKVWSSRHKINVMRSKTRETTDNKVRSKSDMQLVATVILILTTFAVLYVPFLVMSVIDSKMVKYDPEMHVSFLYLAWFHCVINPIVYSVMNPQIKRACLSLLSFGRYKSKQEVQHLTIHTIM